MKPPGLPLSPTHGVETKRIASAKEQIQQRTSAQTRYVTILPPKSMVRPSEPDHKAEKPALPQYFARGNDAPFPKRLFQHKPPTESRYVSILLKLDKIPRLHNIYASVFIWLILAGYIVFPGTFMSLKRSDTLQNAANKNRAGRAILDTVQNASFLWVAGFCCLIGMVGIILLWRKWQANYIWLVNRIFLPSLLNAMIAFINTLINVYTAQNGDWSVTAAITVIMTSACAGVNSILLLVYNNWLLYQIKKNHEIEASNGSGAE